ncbi:MAG: AAA family ATPase [Actinobacteria bacterium]|nr:AAA family ATPase [Actinomycetota bacterium]
MSGLQSLLDDHSVVVCVGCGGVGKTTVAASIAVRAALQGRRALCLTIDPARRLATSLGLGQMRASEQVVDHLAFLEAGLILRGELWAAVVDPKATFDRVVTRLARDEATAQRILDNRIYRYVSASMPGVQEYMAMERLAEVKESPRFDLVVLDTPPTSNALDFLDAPRRVLEAMNSQAVQWLLALHGDGVLSQGTSFVLRHLAKIAGGDVIQRMAALAADFDTLLDGLRERAAEVGDMLRGPDVAYLLVTSPDPLAVDEAVYLNHRLVDLGLGGGALVVNRMRPLRSGASSVTRAQLLSTLERAGISGAGASGLIDALQCALHQEQSLAQADLAEVTRLARSCADIDSVCLVPGLERDVYDLTQLARLHEWLFAV